MPAPQADEAGDEADENDEAEAAEAAENAEEAAEDAEEAAVPAPEAGDMLSKLRVRIKSEAARCNGGFSPQLVKQWYTSPNFAMDGWYIPV